MAAEPTHVDSHQHVHRSAPVDAAVHELGDRLSVPVRHRTRAVTYLGGFYGQNGTGTSLADAITPERLDVRAPGETMKDFVRVWKTGKAQKSARISFTSPELLWKVLTAKRRELLKALCGAGPVSIREVAPFKRGEPLTASSASHVRRHFGARARSVSSCRNFTVQDTGTDRGVKQSRSSHA